MDSPGTLGALVRVELAGNRGPKACRGDKSARDPGLADWGPAILEKPTGGPRLMQDSRTSIREKKEMIGLVALTWLLMSFFIDKPFHVDDPLFLWSAKQILKDPFDFYGIVINWNGFDLELFNIAKNPPLASFFLACWGGLFGFSETALHIGQLIFSGSLALGVYVLSRRFCGHNFWISLAVVFTPAFTVSSSNLMCDTMMLGFWVWAVHLWLLGHENSDSRTLIIASLIIACSALSKYFGVALIPLLLAYTLLKGTSREKLTRSLILLVPIFLLLVYEFYTRSAYGKGLLSEAMLFANEHSFGSENTATERALMGLTFMGGCAPLALLFAPFLGGWKLYLSTLLSMVLIFILQSNSAVFNEFFFHEDGSHNYAFIMQSILMSCSAVLLVFLSFRDVIENRTPESFLLLLWVLGTIAFAGMVNWTISARSVFPVIVPGAILVYRALEKNTAFSRKNRNWLAAAPLVPALVLSFIVARADYSLAITVKEAAESIGEKLRDHHGTLWFQGHWGFQYYFEALGAKPIDFRNLLYRADETVVTPLNNSNLQSLPKERARFVERLEFEPMSWVSTFSDDIGAGFYTDMWGPLPYAFGKVEKETYVIHNIVSDFKGP